LFVDNWVYDWGLRFERSISSYWLGLYQECIDSATEILMSPGVPENVVEVNVLNMQEANLALQRGD
jgi:hypothetical protein